MDFKYYKVMEPMRWDQIAYLAWGEAERMTDLLNANQNIGVYNWVPAGVVFACPIILAAAIIPNPALVPAWKQ